MFIVKKLNRPIPNLNTLTNTGQKTVDLIYLGTTNLKYSNK